MTSFSSDLPMEMDRWMDRKTDGTDEPTSHASHETARSSASLTEYGALVPARGRHRYRSFHCYVGQVCVSLIHTETVRFYYLCLLRVLKNIVCKIVSMIMVSPCFDLNPQIWAPLTSLMVALLLCFDQLYFHSQNNDYAVETGYKVAFCPNRK